MLSREETISRLISDRDSRASYIRSKLNQLVPSQIRALRLKADWSQLDLGQKADMKQSRISASESGMANFSIETLVRLAAALRVGLQVRFVPYSEMLDWERNYSQDAFIVKTLEDDEEFIRPGSKSRENTARTLGAAYHSASGQSSINYPVDIYQTGRASSNVANRSLEAAHG